MAEIMLPPRARVSFGLPEDGIEVSNISYSDDSILQLQTAINTSNSGNKSNNSEVRLFHAPNLEMEDDDDDSEDERELTFLLEDELLDGGTTTISEQTPVPQEEAVAPTTPPPAPKKKRRKKPEVMKAIDNLEKVLKNVNTSSNLAVAASKEPASLKRSSQSSISLKKTVSKLFGSNKKQKQEQQQTDEEDTIAAAPKESFRTPRSKGSKSNNMNKTTKCKSKKTSSWKLLWNKSKRRGGEHALLLPTKHDDNYSLPDASWKWDVLGGKQTTPSSSSSSSGNDIDIPTKKRNNFFGKLFQKISKSNISKDETDGVSSSVSSPDKTRSLTMDDESDDGGESELLDHLVNICDKTSSLELERGFSSLQERIRSRSFSRLPPESPAGNRTQMFSTSFLEQSPAGSRGSKSSRNINSNNNSTTSNSTSRDESIPSFASLEEFLTSVSDETHAASLEALLFEQELEKLSTEELAELLDSELEKLMREGF